LSNLKNNVMQKMQLKKQMVKVYVEIKSSLNGQKVLNQMIVEIEVIGEIEAIEVTGEIEATEVIEEIEATENPMYATPVENLDILQEIVTVITVVVPIAAPPDAEIPIVIEEVAETPVIKIEPLLEDLIEKDLIEMEIIKNHEDMMMVMIIEMKKGIEMTIIEDLLLLILMMKREMGEEKIRHLKNCHLHKRVQTLIKEIMEMTIEMETERKEATITMEKVMINKHDEEKVLLGLWHPSNGLYVFNAPF